MGVKSEYTDTGCELNPTCLNCPVPVDKCPLEHRKRLPHYREARDAEIMGLHNEGVSVDALSIRFNLSIRTIYRIIEDAR